MLAGCGGTSGSGSKTAPVVEPKLGAKVTCTPGSVEPLRTGTLAYAGIAPDGAVAYRTPGGAVARAFGKTNANGYPTVFGVLGAVVDGRCQRTWYRVQLPIRPNGATGYVRAEALRLERVTTRIVVDISARRLMFYRRGALVLSATVAVGSQATPTPTGRYYINQRLVPSDRNGPFGPGALGISAFSNVLTGWVQGGPIAIHGTNEPWSIGKAASNGCIRLPNTTLEQLFRVADAGTPVVIRA